MDRSKNGAFFVFLFIIIYITKNAPVCIGISGWEGCKLGGSGRVGTL
jgi:hypothetical protein